MAGKTPAAPHPSSRHRPPHRVPPPKDEGAAGEAEPKGTPTSDRHKTETAHNHEAEAPARGDE